MTEKYTEGLISFDELVGVSTATKEIYINSTNIKLILGRLNSELAERIQQQAIEYKANSQKLKTAVDVYEPFPDEEKKQKRLFNMALKGWEMSEADSLHLLNDPEAIANGVPFSYPMINGQTFECILKSASEEGYRKFVYDLNKEAVANKKIGQMMPSVDKQRHIKASKIQYLMLSWNVNREINLSNVSRFCVSASDVVDAMLLFAENEFNYCMAKNHSTEELSELSKNPFEFNQDNKERLLENSVEFREQVVSLSKEDDVFRPQTIYPLEPTTPEELGKNAPNSSVGTAVSEVVNSTI